MNILGYQIQMRGRTYSRREVVTALRSLDRAQFVPGEYADRAEMDRPLPIGEGQTVSQPSLVAFMTAALQLQPESHVLEVGTGSGFQAALLGRLVREVFTVEIIPSLAEEAQHRLEELGFENVHCRCGDGYHGWPEHAPYDGIVISAATESIPPPLLEQLAEGGHLIAPVGTASGWQDLTLFRKRYGRIQSRRLCSVAFVPFTRSDTDASSAS